MSSREINGQWDSSQRYSVVEGQVCKVQVNVMKGLCNSYIRSSTEVVHPTYKIKKYI